MLKSSIETNRLAFNSDGSLASVIAGDVALSYKYDALGRRVLKESSAADSVLYLYDQADRCIAEYTTQDDCATLACSAGYVYADADALGAPIAVEDSAGSYQYVATDPQGSVIYQTPSCSHIVLVKYDAYGNIYNTSAGDLNLPFRFAGMRYEKDADIYLTPNRAYSPAIGRWLQPDPLGTLPNAKQGNRFSPLSQYTDGKNLYEYCAGAPINERDVLGLYQNVNDDYNGSWGGYRAVVPNCYSKKCGKCGPDITEELRRVRLGMIRDFNKMDDKEKKRACILSYSPALGWDIYQLHDKNENFLGNEGTGDCKGTVWFNGQCYNATRVNYYLWGIGRRLCGDSYKKTLKDAALWKKIAYQHSLNPETEDFIRAGWMNTSKIRSCNRGCKKGNKYKGTLHYNWGMSQF
ncbi:MAG: RHS repeat domain-containing protein [Phycisphaerae bacterium]